MKVSITNLNDKILCITLMSPILSMATIFHWKSSVVAMWSACLLKHVCQSTANIRRQNSWLKNTLLSCFVSLASVRHMIWTGCSCLIWTPSYGSFTDIHHIFICWGSTKTAQITPRISPPCFWVKIVFWYSIWPSYHMKSYLNTQRCTWPPENLISQVAANRE